MVWVQRIRDAWNANPYRGNTLAVLTLGLAGTIGYFVNDLGMIGYSGQNVGVIEKFRDDTLKLTLKKGQQQLIELNEDAGASDPLVTRLRDFVIDNKTGELLEGKKFKVVRETK